MLELKSWAIVALLEVDGKSEPVVGDGEIRPSFDGHAFVRHHSGPGCSAMGILIHQCLRKRVIDIVCDWRSMRIDLLADSLDGCHHPARSFLFSHLAHDIFQDSLNVAIALGRSRPRGSLLSWLGDLNADQGNGDRKFESFLTACDNLQINWCPSGFANLVCPSRGNQTGNKLCFRILRLSIMWP